LLIQSVSDMQGLRGQRQQLYTVFSELFSNALEHGVLGLDSGLKESAGGFTQYYREREAKLGKLEEGTIRIKIEHSPEDDGGVLRIRFEDSGTGFNYQKSRVSLEDNQGHSGRGVHLLQSLCDKVTYDGNGNIVEVVYRWK